jgi:hypothetical protein
MESYIVRIYRRGEDDAEAIAGTVEIVGKGGKAFKDFDDLREILNSQPKEGEKRKRRSGKRQSEGI